MALAATAVDALLLLWALGGWHGLIANERAITLIVLWGVGALWLAWLRPIGRQDTIAVDLDHGIVLTLLFVLPLVSTPLAALGERTGLGRWPEPLALLWAGVAIAGLGLLIRIAAMAQLGARFAPVAAMQREHSLETRGLYRFVRHPGYLGAWLAALGGSLAFQSVLGLPLVALMGWLLHVRVAREEALLERHFGEVYRLYRARTGRFLPRLVPPAAEPREAP
jgi:protein-S-isoprenylcysteine O-methyltransferase Ste14